MAKNFSTLRDALPQTVQAESQAMAEAMELEMDLADLRRARKLTQEALAQVLEISQGSVAKMEKRTDMYISSMRKFIEAMGGELEVVAKFPDHSVRITQFSELGNS